MACVGTTSFTSCSSSRLRIWWLSKQNWSVFPQSYIRLYLHSVRELPHVTFFHDARRIVEPVGIFNFVVHKFSLGFVLRTRPAGAVSVQVVPEAEAVWVKLHQVISRRLRPERSPDAACDHTNTTLRPVPRNRSTKTAPFPSSPIRYPCLRKCRILRSSSGSRSSSVSRAASRSRSARLNSRYGVGLMMGNFRRFSVVP